MFCVVQVAAAEGPTPPPAVGDKRKGDAPEDEPDSKRRRCGGDDDGDDEALLAMLQKGQQPQRQRAVRSEVDQYFDERALDGVTPGKKGFARVAEYWRGRKHQWPTLYRLARTFLAFPASSVPCERLFSDAGNVVSKKRCGLDCETVRILLFLHANRGLVDRVANGVLQRAAASAAGAAAAAADPMVE